MSETIPSDIMEEASRLTESAWQLKHPELAAKVAAALLAERRRAIEECAGRAAARQAIYEKKRAEADPLAKDECTRWEKYDFGVEAMEYMEAAIRALLK
jgi:hypothetical protein